MSSTAHVSTILGGRCFTYTFVKLENKEKPFPVFQLVHATKLDGKLYASWMFENLMGCTGTQTVYLITRSWYPRKNCTKAEVQNCAFSLSSVGRILVANLGAKLSKLCKARSRICSLHEQERQKLQIGHLRLNNLGSICMSSCWIRLVHLALSKDVCANKLCTKSTSGHLPKSTEVRIMSLS